MSEFSLEQNAFAVLDVGLRSNHEQIVEAHDDRLFEASGDESKLSEARSRLTVARDRIDEETTFLPELSPRVAREVLRAVKTAASINQALLLISEVPNLSRINVIADLMGRLEDRQKLIGPYVKAHADFDPAAARECLEQSRAASGIGQIKDAAWQAALTKLRNRHAAVFGDTIAGHSQGPAILTGVLEEARGSDMSGWHRGFLDEVVNRYDRWSQAKLGMIEEQLDAAVEAVRADPQAPQLLHPIKEKLRGWDELSQPVQLRDEAKGLDEPRSKRVFEKVRELAIWLNNTHDQHEAALELSRALQTTFPELPSVVDQLANDIDTLRGLVEHARQANILGPLTAIAERAEECLDKLTTTRFTSISLDIGTSTVTPAKHLLAKSSWLPRATLTNWTKILVSAPPVKSRS